MTYLLSKRPISGSSFTGSFVGTGFITGNLEGTASVAHELHPELPDFDLILITGSTIITGSLSASIFIGDGSQLFNIITSSYSKTSSYATPIFGINQQPNIQYSFGVSGSSHFRNPNKYRINLWGLSDQIVVDPSHNLSWSDSNISVSNSVSHSPVPGVYATALIPKANNSLHQVIRNAPLGSSNSWTGSFNTSQSFSVYAKYVPPNGYSFIYLTIGDFNGNVRSANFNIASGTIGTFVPASHSVFIHPLESSSGWYRCGISFNSKSGSSATIARIGICEVDNTQTFTGNGTSSVLVWGTQFEPDTPAPTSYISTNPSGTVYTGPLPGGLGPNGEVVWGGQSASVDVIHVEHGGVFSPLGIGDFGLIKTRNIIVSQSLMANGPVSASSGMAVAGGNIVITGVGNDVLLDNNNEYNIRDTTGTPRIVATLDSSNILIFGPASGITETRIRAGTSDYISMNVGSSQVAVTNFLYNSIRNSNGLIDHYYASNLHTGSLAASRYLILFSDTSGSTVNGGYWRTGKGGSWTPNTSSQNGNMTWGVAHTGSITEKMVLTTSSFIPHVNVDLDTVGTGIKIKEGTNATLGVVTLVAGAATVSTTKVTASSRIFLTKQTNPVAGSSVSIHTRSAGTSFGISSSNAADTADVAWMIIEPSP